MSKKIPLSNFLKMTPEAPQASATNQHYLISGANPTYYLDTTGTQEEQIAPLIASLNWKKITATLDGSIVAMCPNGFITSYSVFVMTSTSQVFGVNTLTGLVDSLGYLTGQSVAINSGKLVCTNGNIYAFPSVSSSIYRLPSSSIGIIGGVASISIASPAIITLANHGFQVGQIVKFSTTGALPTGLTAGTSYYVISAGLTANQFEVSTSGGGSAVNTSGTQSGVHTVSIVWTSFASGTTITQATKVEPFGIYCMFSDGSAVKRIDSSYNVLSGIDIGNGNNIVGMKNYNGKYIAFASQTGIDYTQNYLYLWNGISVFPQYSVKIPGRFIDMKVIDCVLYMAIGITGGKTSIYYLKGTVLVELFTTQYSMIDSHGQFYDNYDVTPMFNYNNNIGIRLTSNSELTYPLLIHGNVEVGKEEFILTSGDRFANFTVGADGLLYAYDYIPSGISNIYYYPTSNTSTQSILYKSQWIPLKNLQGIDIIYDTPPQTGTDAINVTIYGDGEDIITGTSTTVLDSISSTNLLNQKRTRLDCKGFAGDKIKIVLSTVNTGVWRPIIREISLIVGD